MKTRQLTAVLSATILGNSVVAPSIATAADEGVETIVVTATRREESLQKVPIAVSALSSKSLEKAGSTGTLELASQVPSLNITKQSTSVIPFIRGVGSADGSAGQEGAVAVYVDGVYIPSPAASIFSFNNIERIEVLKGPQGTLFGRNSNGGLIQVVTKTPSSDFSVDGSIGYGNYKAYEGKLYATGGLAGKVAGDVALYYRKQDKPFGHNINTGSGWGNGNEFAGRTKWLVTPGDDTDITLTYGYTRINNGGLGNNKQGYPGTIGMDGVTTYTGNFYDYTGNVDATGNSQGWDVSGRIDHRFGPVDFKSITAYRSFHALQRFDNDLTPVPIIDVDIREQRYETFTQELQLLSGPDSAFKWIIGGFYMNDRAGFAGNYGLGLFGAGLGGAGVGVQRMIVTSSWSVFGEATVPIEGLGDTNFTAGFRYTSDTRVLTGQTLLFSNNNLPTLGPNPLLGDAFGPPFPNSIPDARNEAHFTKPTFRVILDHRFTDTLMAYVSYNRGFKAGNFNTASSPVTMYGPETVDAIEIGAKTDLLNGRLRLNADVFIYKYDNMQLPVYLAGSLNNVNAAQSQLKGVEFEGEVVPMENVSVRFGLTVMDGKFKSFPNAPINTPAPGGFPSVGGSFNAEGFRLPRVSTVTLNLSPSVTIPTPVGNVDATVSYYYNSGFYWEVSHTRKQESYSLLNANVGWTHPSEKFGARIWGKNLTGTEYAVFAVTQVGTQDSFAAAPPRTFGLELFFHL